MLKRLPGLLLPTTLKLLLLAILLWLALLARATWADMTQAEALDAGKQLGNAATSTVLPTVDANTLPGFTTASPPETQYQSAGIGLEDTARAHLLTASPDSPEGTVFNSISTRPQFSLNRDDPLVQHTDSLIADAENAQDAGTGTACKTLTVTDSPTTGDDRCMEYLKTVDSTCKRTLNLNCTARAEGDSGGIVKDSIAGDMKWSYSYPNLLVGTIANDYWGTGVYDRTTVFSVKNKADIQSFVLNHAWFDDWLWVKLNGHTVYVGPYGGDRLDTDVYQERCTDSEGWCWGQPTRPGSWLAANGYSKYGSSYRKQVQQCTSSEWGQYCYNVWTYWDPVSKVCYTDSACSYWELSTSWNKALNVNLLPYLNEGSNTLWMRTVVAGGGEAAINIEARQWGNCTTWQESWTNTCGSLASDPLCELQSSACTDSSNPRVISGTSVSRPCWQYTDTYRCYDKNGSKGEDDYCQELRKAGCTQSDSTCADDLYGRCIAWEQSYQCSVPGKSRMVEDCSAATYCQDGNCFDAGYEANADFGLAASYLSSAEAMARDMDGSFNIFTGNSHKCKKVALGFKNCCKNSGWGLSFNLSQCSESEKVLGEKRGAGMCHYLGSYKDNSLFPNRYDSYCCFNSKLARIIHEQGRPYVPLAWGSAKSPVCRGFTPEELQQIDFGKIDFSEFFADALANANQAIKPGSGALGEQIKDKLIRLLPQ